MVATGQYGETINHFNVLRTIEDMYGLSHAGASATATSITDIWTSTTTVPAAPSSLTATAAATDQINLAWTDNSTTETGILIERSTDNITFAQVASVGGAVTSYSDTGLTAGTDYYYRVRASNAAGNSAYSNTANDFARGVATSLSLSGPSSATAGASFNITVTALDAFGHTATGYTGKDQLSSSDSQAVLPASYTFTTADAGRHTFSVTLKTAGSQSVTASDTATGSINGKQSGITVSAAAASTLSVSGYPISTTAGVAHNVTVTARDAYGNTATGYAGTIKFTSSDSQAGLPASYTFTAADAGSHTFSIALKTAGSQSFTATDTATGSITGTQSGITVSAASASTLSVSGFPTPTTAGAAHNATVTVHDAYGNTATGYLGTVQLTSSDSQAVLPANYTFTATDAGTHTFSVTLKTAGSQSLTATDTATSTITGTQSGITVNPAAASTLSVNGPAGSTVGVSFSVTVTVRDALGNTATGYLGTVQFTSSDAQAGRPANYTFTAGDGGVHTFSVTLNTLGSQSVTVTDTATSSITGSASVNVTSVTSVPAAPSKLTATAAATDQINLAWTDNATTETGILIERSTDNVNFTQIASLGGTATSYSDTGLTAGTDYFYRVRASNSAGNSAYSNTASDFARSVATSLSLSGPSSATAGASFNVTVTALDTFGHSATGYVGTVQFTSSDRQAVLPANYTFTAADAGSHTFSVTLKTAGSWSLTATDTVNSPITGSQSNISVNPAAATHFRITGPTSVVHGTAFSITVTALDAFGNTATGYRGTVQFASSANSAALPNNYSFTASDNGVHTFTGLVLHKKGRQTITVFDAANSTIQAIFSIEVL
jgi:hypothetical protein